MYIIIYTTLGMETQPGVLKRRKLLFANYKLFFAFVYNIICSLVDILYYKYTYIPMLYIRWDYMYAIVSG